MSKPIIILDAGHGGHDSGAVGPNGLREKDVALAVTLIVGALLLGEFDVRYTRNKDVFIELGERAAIANRANADAVVSIHCNSGPVGSGDGFEVFTTPGETDSDKLATDLFTSFGAGFPEKRKRMDLGDGDPDKEASFAVIRLSKCRAALFELEFIHTTAGEAWLKSPQNQSASARALAAGIRKHFGFTAAPLVPAPTGPDLHTEIRQTTTKLQALVALLS